MNMNHLQGSRPSERELLEQIRNGGFLGCPKCNSAASRDFRLCPVHSKLTDMEAELARLRSDEWLWAAAQEIANHRTDEDNGELALAILKKHRDGA